jgi:hypothetical protein
MYTSAHFLRLYKKRAFLRRWTAAKNRQFRIDSQNHSHTEDQIRGKTGERRDIKANSPRVQQRESRQIAVFHAIYPHG